MKKLFLFSVLLALFLAMPGVALSTLFYEEYTGSQFFGEGGQGVFGFDLNSVGGGGDNTSLNLTTDSTTASGTYYSGYIYAKFYSEDTDYEKASFEFNISNDGSGAINLGSYTFNPTSTPFIYALTIPLGATFLNSLDNSSSGTLYLTATNTSSNNNDFDLQAVGLGVNNSPTAAPEPATLLLLGSSLVGLGFFSRRKFKK